MNRIIEPIRKLAGEIEVPGDKSISHRAVMFGALSEGITQADHFLMSADCLSTISCFQKMGIEIQTEKAQDSVIIHGKGLWGLQRPKERLFTGNSGTTTRLLAGILAGQHFESVLDGDASIRRRPMNRVIDPLRRMGAEIKSENENGCAPLCILGSPLRGIEYRSPVASAQVKTCILLAGLYADTASSVIEPALSRNHSELMLRGFGADISSEPFPDHAYPNAWKASIRPNPVLCGQSVTVPGDISSAAYFLAAALIVPESEVLVKNVGINQTRAGFLEVLRSMGADLVILNEREQGGEPVADLLVKSSSLHGTVIEGALIPALIDELPVCAVLAACAEGKTVIRDAAELKVKESDRIAVMTQALRAMGADVTPTADGMIINGGRPLHGAVIDSHMDHRIAMSLAVAALVSEGPVTIKDADCVGISYPDFYNDLMSLNAG